MLFCLLLLLNGEPAWARWPDTEDEFIERHSAVEDWVAFSPRYNVTPECDAGRQLRWAYFSRSPETYWNWIAVSHHLQVPYSTFQSRLFFNLVRNTTEATDPYMSTENIAFIKWRGMGQMLCHVGDILVFGDVTADARPVLQGNCTTPIVLHLTRRFTVGVRDMQPYLRLMKQVVRRPWVWFVASNPFEKYFFSRLGVHLPEARTLLLRPVGASFLARLPEGAGQRAGRRVAVLDLRNADALGIKPWVTRMKLQQYVTYVGGLPFGPGILPKFRGVLHIPHQPSLLAMYDAMAAGAVFILPSPRFFLQLLSAHMETEAVFCCRDAIAKNPDSWEQLMDWWHPDFRDGHILFDRWDELADILRGKGRFTPAFFQTKRATSRELMLASRRKSLAGFQSLYRRLRTQSCEYSKKPELWPPQYCHNWARNLTGKEPFR